MSSPAAAASPVLSAPVKIPRVKISKSLMEVPFPAFFLQLDSTAVDNG